MTLEQLLPPEVRKSLPPLNSTLGDKELVAQVKFFYPDAGWTWYGAEFDGHDLFFGLVDGFVKELGSFRLSELMKSRGRLGLEIERDFFFQPTPVKELMAD